MKMVIAVDGSSCSKFSIQALAHFKPPDDLTLVHALNLPDFNYPLMTPELRTEAQETIYTQLHEQGEAILDEAQQHVPANWPNVRRVHQTGHPVDTIIETARTAHADLLVLGARGLGPVKELVLGSVSQRILMHAPCSTLIIKAPVPRIRKILLPVEGPEDADAAIKLLSFQPFPPPVEIEVFSVWAQPQLAWPTTIKQSDTLELHAIEEARTRMNGILERLLKLNFICQAHVGIGDPAYAILEQAKASQSDLIMMGTHRRGGFSRFLLGSVSHSVLHKTTCPVLLVR